MNLVRDLALFPLGQEMVLFSESAQRVVCLNTTGTLIFRMLQAGATAPDMAQSLTAAGLASAQDADHWVMALLGSLATHGMIDDGSGPQSRSDFPDEGQRGSSVRAASMQPFVPFEPAAERRYCLLGTCALVRFAFAEQAEWVDAALGHLRAEGNCEPTVTFDVQGVPLGARGSIRSFIYRNGEPHNFTQGLLRLAPVVKGAVWQAAVAAYNFLFYFHAGVVGTGGNCILLPGAAGSGKSSLTTALVHRGFHYFSDEVALIERDTFRVPPVPLAICVKRMGVPIIAPYYPQVGTLIEHHRYDGRRVRYLPPPWSARKQQPAMVSHIVFPRYKPNVPTELEQIAASEALSRLMSECLATRLRLDAKDIADVVQWMAPINCYSLTFSSLDDAAELIQQTV